MNVTVRGYISQFRVRELQAVLEQLGLSKTGRKADLVARIFAFFGEEPPADPRHESGPREQWRLEAAERAITATYQAMMGLPPGSRSASPVGGMPATPQRPQQRAPGSLSSAQAVAAQQAATAAALAHSFRQSSTPAKRAGGAASPFSLKLHSDKFTNARSTAIRCICGDNADRGHMIQCEGDKCGVWQHSVCVGVNTQEPPEHFFCEWCRVSLADPFWEPRQRAFFPAAALRPVKGQPSAYLTPGEQPQPYQSTDKGFMVQAADSAVFRTQTETQLQAVCVQLGDVVPFRLHWPRGVDLRANNMQYRPYGRNPSHKLGNNARDDSANIGPMCFTGKNRVTLTAFDERRYAFGVQLVRKRSQAEVRDMMAPPLELPAAVAAVRRAVTGKDAGDGKAGSDSDDFVATSMIISLRCPLSGSRIVTPARFVGVSGLGCFDLDTYLTMAERSRKWQCPHSMRNMSIRELHIDTYVSRLLPFFKSEPDVMEVEVDDKGRWRRVGAGDSAWTDITADPASVPTPVAVKQDTGTVQAEALSSDSEEESEGAELRAAATAYKATAKRKREDPAGAQNDDVIVLSSDSDEETSCPAQRRQVAPPGAQQQAAPENLLRIRLPSQGGQQPQPLRHQPQQRTPQSAPRQATMAQAFSRAATQEQHQVNAELRPWPPSLQHSTGPGPQQQARPNGRLATGPVQLTNSVTSGLPQVPQAARPPSAASGSSAPLQQQHRQHHYARPPAMAQPPTSGPQRLMPQIPAVPSSAPRPIPPPHPSYQPQAHPTTSQPQQHQPQYVQHQSRAWQAPRLPPVSGPPLPPVSPAAWVPQQRQPPQPQPQAYRPFAPAQAATNQPPRRSWVEELATATAAADAAVAAQAPGTSAPRAPPPLPHMPSVSTAPSSAAGRNASGSTAPVNTAPAASAMEAQPSQQQHAPSQQPHPAQHQPSAHVWGTPEAAQPPLPPPPPPPLPLQQQTGSAQQQQQQPQQSGYSPALPPLPPSAPPPLPQPSQPSSQPQHTQSQAAGQSGTSVQMSPEEFAAEAQLALLPDDMFEEFLVDPDLGMY